MDKNTQSEEQQAARKLAKEKRITVAAAAELVRASKNPKPQKPNSEDK